MHFSMQGDQIASYPLPPPRLAAMAPHLTPDEQDYVVVALAAGKAAADFFNAIAKKRNGRRVEMVNITAIRRLMRGKSHRRGKLETRGRKRLFSRRNVFAMDAARRKFIKATKGTKQAKWDLIRAKARAPCAHRSTVARAFAREGLGVKLRRSREKPQRTAEHEKERVDLCGKMRRWPLKRFTEDIDLIIDNKRFDVPTTPLARAHLAKQRLCAQLRTRAEGLQANFTKPRANTHRRNLGGSVLVCAGISNCRVVLWEYCNKWNGQVSADMYKGPIMNVIVKHRGRKPSYLLAEDNDPSGYKSGKALAEKRRLGIRTIEWPRYSPDLMPLDFCLWADISKRMVGGAPTGRESVVAFKRRLRRVALQTPIATVRAAVGAMRSRAAMIWAAGGKDIARD